MNLIIVDIQPMYRPWISESVMQNVVKAIETAEDVVWYFNGHDVGSDTESCIIDMMMDYLDPDEIWRKITFIEKHYGFLRNWMDRGECHYEIVETIKLMMTIGTNDTRELEEHADDDDMMTIPDFELPDFKFAHICGGCDQQCLLEMELLLKANNIETKRLPSAIF